MTALELQPPPLATPATPPAVAPALDELLSVPREAVASRNYDLGAINLVCAVGLAGAEHMDVPAYLARLDEWAEAIRKKTAQNWRVYHRKSAEFDFNRNVFRALYLCYRLTTDYGIRYNPAQLRRRDVWDFSNADDQFICGLLGPGRAGTCASLPVLAVAIGRRLGYPLHLVMAPNHLLLRWDDGKDRFNVEWNGDGARVHEDDYYYTWPLRWTERAHRLNRTHGVFLTNLSPARELAKCLYNRSVVLRETGRVEEGLEALDAAERLDPSAAGRTTPSGSMRWRSCRATTACRGCN